MATKCYGIDGTPYATTDRYMPCNTTAVATGGHTQCCALGDHCLTNGLCRGEADEQRKANLYWRNGCTDPTWNDPACAKQCVGIDYPDTHAVFYCLQKDSWCCASGTFNAVQDINITCCSRSDLTFSAPDPLAYTVVHVNITSTVRSSERIASPTSLTSSVGLSVSSITSTWPTQSAQSTSGAINGLSAAPDNKIGTYVGVPLGFALAISIGVIAWLVFENRKLTRAHMVHEFETTTAYRVETAPHHELAARPEELSGDPGYAVEMPGSR